MNTPFSRSYWFTPGKLLTGFYHGGRQKDVMQQKLGRVMGRVGFP